MTAAPLCIIGLGQLGRFFADAARQRGMDVLPVDRATPRPLAIPPRAPVLVAVREDALDSVLADLARADHAHDVILLQNELFPSAWQHLPRPTVMCCWFNRKPGAPLLVGAPTTVFGPHAELVADLHAATPVRCTILSDEESLARACAAKYAFILVINALGTHRDLTVGEWLRTDEPTVRAAVRESLVLGAARAGVMPDPGSHETEVMDALAAFSAMPTRGRTAGARVITAGRQARERGLDLPVLRTLAGPAWNA